MEHQHGPSPKGPENRIDISFSIGIFLLSWTLLISYPLFIYSWVQFNKYYKERYFEKRGVALILLQTIIMFISCCIGSPIKILYDDMKIVVLSPLLQTIIGNILQGPLILSIIMIMLIRIWIVNFNHQLQVEIAESSWKQQLSSFSIDSTSFYTKYKNTLGSLSWCIKCVATIYIVLCVGFVIIDFMLSTNKQLSHSIAYGILIIAYIVTITTIIIIWIKFPKFKDNMFIRYELRESVWCVIGIVVVGIILLFISRIVDGLQTLPQFVEILLMNGLCYIAVLRVIKLNGSKRNIDIINLAENINVITNAFTMNRILQNKHGYTEFMNFLVQEFASENLCFATEYSQFRESLNLNEKQKSLMGCNVVFNTAFSDKKSQFQANDTTLDCQEFIEIINKLYHKYIAFDISTYEINVSYNARLSLAVIIDNKYKQYVVDNKENDVDLQNIKMFNLPKNNLAQTIQIIIPILEVILFEVTRLLQNAFSRFKRSGIWIELCNEIINGDNNNNNNDDDEILNALRTRQSISAAAASKLGSSSNLLKIIKLRTSFKSRSVPMSDSPICGSPDTSNSNIPNMAMTTSEKSMCAEVPDIFIEDILPSDEPGKDRNNTSIDLIRVTTDSMTKNASFIE